MLFFVIIFIRCVNSRKTKTHEPCRARYTLHINDTIEQLIIGDEIQSKKQSQKRFKLIDRKNPALFIVSNYNLTCKKCTPTTICMRHLSVMPIMYIYMPKRTIADYDTVFADVKHYYKKYFSKDLKLSQKIQIDAELAVIQSVRQNFPESTILLCRVHLCHAWFKRFKFFMGGLFYKNDFLLSIWKWILGITFLDLSNYKILRNVYRIFEEKYSSPKMKGLKKKFKLFVGYLCKNYLNENAKYPHTLWNYHSFLCQSDFTITTNALENLNGKLKSKCGTGYLSRNNSFRRVKEFHMNYITLYTAKVVHNRMPSMKAKYLKR